jgi:hypothetical protein
MNGKWIPAFIIPMMLALACSHIANGPMLPSATGNSSGAIKTHLTETTDTGNRYLWGLWTVEISADRSTVDIIATRAAEMHLNVVRLIEVAPCQHCLLISNIHVVGPNELEADAILKHPYPGQNKFTGFDVRGIFISGSDFTFPVSGRQVALGDGVPRLVDPDGYTSLFNPAEFPPTDPPALGYIPGKKATGGDLSATLCPFMAYGIDAPRRMFAAGGFETRTFHVYAPAGPIHFGYAVDACWHPVDVVIDPVTDFPPEANCLEAYRINVDIPVRLNSSWMSQNPINVEVFDHQGLDTISSVTVEAPDIFFGEVGIAYSTQTGEESWLFSGFVPNETEAVTGEYPLLVKVIDTESDLNLGAIYGWGVAVAEVKKGWARTWGGTDNDHGEDVAVDVLGNIYVTGYFQSDEIDFNPGSGFDIHLTGGGNTGFLSKFDSNGKFLWARTWGETGHMICEDVAADVSGNAYVTGRFQDEVDFDPGIGVDTHISIGGNDIYVSKFDTDGGFVWARTWGGTENDYSEGVAVDSSGNTYVTGYFQDTVDFDPGDGVDYHTSDTNDDSYLSKFDSNGNFVWAKTWGGGWSQRCTGVAVDGSANVYVTGHFYGLVDFDPGSGTDNHGSHGYYDIFLSRFDSDGNFVWARTWGGEAGDAAWCVAVGCHDDIYVVGDFEFEVDFDPGDGIESIEANGLSDIFLSKFDSDGNYVFVRTWGGKQYDIAYGVAVDGSGNPYVTGFFDGEVDLDPGTGTEYHSTNGDRDIFLSRFDPNGFLTWVRAWGGNGSDSGYGVAIDFPGNAYVTGRIRSSDPVDFDPGNGVDFHVSSKGEDIFLSKFPPDGNW